MSRFYTLRHMLISRQDYAETPSHVSKTITGLSVDEMQADARTVRYWVEQVGTPYGWPDREQYSLDAIGKLLKTPGIRLFLLRKDGCPIGYCLTHDEKPLDLQTRFLKAGIDIPENSKITRIEGFGLAQGQTNQNCGDFFLQKIYQIMFDHGDSDYIYLTSRSTNHPRVIAFYQAHGMALIDEEQKPEDRPMNSQSIRAA